MDEVGDPGLVQQEKVDVVAAEAAEAALKRLCGYGPGAARAIVAFQPRSSALERRYAALQSLDDALRGVGRNKTLLGGDGGVWATGADGVAGDHAAGGFGDPFGVEPPVGEALLADHRR